MHYNEHGSTTYLLLFSNPKNKHFLNKLEFKRMVAQSVGLDKRLKVHSSDCFICQKHVRASLKTRMMAFSAPRQNDVRHTRRAAPCSIFSKPNQPKHIIFNTSQQTRVNFRKHFKKHNICVRTFFNKTCFF